MRFLITSVTGRKGYKSFKDLNEYVDFMTKKGHLIKDLQEAEVPYTEKPVKMVKATQSKGWEEVSDFGDVTEDPEKSASLIASTSSSVMKDEANMEFSKSSEKADKNEKGLGGESGDINMSDFKSFDYSEPELETSKNASKAQVEYKEVKNETPTEDKKEDSEPKEEKKEDKKEEKKDSSKKYDKDIEECLKAAGVQLNEDDDIDWSESLYKGQMKRKQQRDKEIKDSLKEGIKDYLPRAGFIRNDDEDKSSSKMGVWGGQGTDEQLRKAKIIAKVKFANGDRMGRVTKDDLEHFDEYKAQYDEIYGSDEELEEGWKDKLKKGAATLGVAASLAGNAMADNSSNRYDYDFDPNHYEQVELDSNDCRNPECSFEDEKPNYEAPRIARMKGNMVIDQFGNEWTREEFDKLANGEDPYYDGARNPNIEEEADDSSAEVIEEDDGLNLEIAECLRAAGC